MDPEHLFLQHLHVIDRVVQFIARRHHLRAEQAEELAASVRLKIIDNNYEVLRKYQGRSSLRTYLTTVVQRHFLDSRIAEWGKWRPSAQARRLGPTAVLLDRMLSRDGIALEEAIEQLRTQHKVAAGREELLGLARQLPVRTRRTFCGADALENLSANMESGAEQEDMDRSAQFARVEAALVDALAALGPEERLILKLRFRDNVQVADISRMLGLDQKRLYRQLERVIKTLKNCLEALGVSREAALAVIGHPANDLSPVLDEVVRPAKPRGGPSI